MKRRDFLRVICGLLIVMLTFIAVSCAKDEQENGTSSLTDKAETEATSSDDDKDTETTDNNKESETRKPDSQGDESDEITLPSEEDTRFGELHQRPLP